MRWVFNIETWYKTRKPPSRASPPKMTACEAIACSEILQINKCELGDFPDVDLDLRATRSAARENMVPSRRNLKLSTG